MEDVIINTIEIVLHTNIPNRKEPVILTNRSIYGITNLENENEHPYFTDNYLLPKSQIDFLSHDKKITLFFNKKKFKEMIELHGTKPDVDKDEIIKKNIDITLEALLPTAFPIVGNYTDSYKEYIEQTPSFKITLQNSIPHTFSSFIPKKFINSVTTEYSYLKINDSIYTVTKVIYLNDFINNPKYYDIIEKYNRFEIWKNKQKLMNENKIVEMKLTVVSLCNELIKTFMKDKETDKKTNDNNLCKLIKFLYSRIKTVNFYEKRMYYNRYNGNRIPEIYENQFYILIETILKIFNLKFDNTPKIYENYDEIICDFKTYDNEFNNNAQRINIFDDLLSKKKLIKKFKANKNDDTNTQYIEYVSKIEIYYDKFKNLIEKVNELLNNLFSSDNYDILRQFVIKIRNIHELINRIFILNTIQETYFNTEIKNLNMTNDIEDKENESNQIKKYFNDNFKEYVEFSEYIKKFIFPNRESNTKLTDMITDYINGNATDLNKYIEYINETFVRFEKSKMNKDFRNFNKTDLNIGFDSYSDLINKSPKHEIHVAVDLIEGKITDEIQKYLYCDFKDKILVNMLPLVKKNKQNKYKIPYSGPFISVVNIEEKLKEKNAKKKKGGRIKYNRTIKIYKNKCNCRNTRRKI